MLVCYPSPNPPLVIMKRPLTSYVVVETVGVKLPPKFYYTLSQTGQCRRQENTCASFGFMRPDSWIPWVLPRPWAPASEPSAFSVRGLPRARARDNRHGPWTIGGLGLPTVSQNTFLHWHSGEDSHMSFLASNSCWPRRRISALFLRACPAASPASSQSSDKSRLFLVRNW